ncbi:MAG: hypothetical protein KJO28_08040 [Desulfofustis sp.]|nr:hypothetical protein [Desulfofustis sp.]NNF47042.1 hypothetical protein [Desulfofustis sp.]NNK57033.1 hypothetical protein [Desulfofustis sp.]
MKFCTAINCLDGRVQIPVITYLKERFKVDYVDVVSEPGPNKILADGINQQLLESIWTRVEISITKHNSKGIAIIGHHDCAGNPVDESAQHPHTAAAVRRIRDRFGPVPVIGLWVDSNWEVSEISLD